MENLPSNKNLNEEEISICEKKLKFIWLLASQPSKTFSINDIVDTIMKSGVMIHEKEFINMMVQNRCRRTGVPLKQQQKEENYEFKNKYMNTDFDYL